MLQYKRTGCDAERRINGSKYYSLCIVIEEIWDLKYLIISVITGVTGMLTKGVKKNLESIPGKHPVDSLQKTAIFGTSHLIGKVLQSETCSLSGGDHRWFKRGSTGGQGM